MLPIDRHGSLAGVIYWVVGVVQGRVRGTWELRLCDVRAEFNWGAEQVVAGEALS